MTDPTVDAYGVRFTTDAWAAFTWRQIWVVVGALAGLAMILWGVMLINSHLSSSLVTTPDGVLIQRGGAGPFPFHAFLLEWIGVVLLAGSRTFWPNPWRYSMSIEERLESEGGEQ